LTEFLRFWILRAQKHVGKIDPRWGTLKAGDTYPSVTIYTGVSTDILPLSTGQLELSSTNPAKPGIFPAFIQYGLAKIPIPR